MILGLKLWLRLEHAVANRSHPDAEPGSENGPEVVIASLSVTPPAPHYAVEELRIDSASQRRIERRFLRG